MAGILKEGIARWARVRRLNLRRGLLPGLRNSPGLFVD